MKSKKFLIIIGIILLTCFLVYMILSMFINREIFCTFGSKYGNCRIFENGKMIIENRIKGNKEISLKKDELSKLKKLINEDKEEYSTFTYPSSDPSSGLSVDKVVWSYGYYYNFSNPFHKNTVYDGKSSDYVFDLLEKYCNN